MWCVQAAARRLCFFVTFCRRNLALCTCEELHEVSMSLMATHVPEVQLNHCPESGDRHIRC